MANGIFLRHSRNCAATSESERCTCKPSVQAWAYDHRSGRKIYRSFGNGAGARAAARQWRSDVLTQLHRGTMQAPTAQTLREAAEAWLEGAREGTIRNRSGDPYKPSVIRSYESALTLRVLPAVGARKLSELRRVDLQDLADRWLADGLDPSTIRNSLMPLRAVYRRAVSRGELAVNPCSGLELPSVRGRRDRYATAEEAAELIAAAPEQDRALWATAFYTGLRRGELMALRWKDVDDAAGVVRVRRSWDMREGVIETKSRAGARTVPITSVLRSHLLQHRLRQGRGGEGLVFGRTATRPFNPTTLRDRTLAAWKRENLHRAEHELEPLLPISLHECRHTFASLMIAAGVNAKALSSYMGHGSIAITLDRYGHLMPGNENEAAELLDAYLERCATVAARP